MFKLNLRMNPLSSLLNMLIRLILMFGENKQPKLGTIASTSQIPVLYYKRDLCRTR